MSATNGKTTSHDAETLEQLLTNVVAEKARVERELEASLGREDRHIGELSQQDAKIQELLDRNRELERGLRRHGVDVDDEAKPSEPVGTLVSDVDTEQVRWLWPGRLALGEPTILDGDPGLGKSTVILNLAARLTTGRAMPLDGGLPQEPGGVVYVTGEDSISHTIRPRLEAAGAALDRVCVVQTIEDERPLLIPNDLPALSRAVRRVQARLVVVDPLMAHLPGSLNAHRDQDVRAALTPLRLFAEEQDVAVLVVRHLNKSSGQGSLYRGGGSIGIIGAFRIGLLMGRDPEDDDRLVLAHLKNNLSRPPASLALRLEDMGDVARVRWTGTTDLHASDLLQGGTGSESRPERSAAEAFLRDVLADGPRPSTDVYEAAEAEGISTRTLKRAKGELDITSEQIEPGSRRWFFVPPWDAEPPGKEATTQNGPLSDGLLSQSPDPPSEPLSGDSLDTSRPIELRVPNPYDLAPYPDTPSTARGRDPSDYPVGATVETRHGTGTVVEHNGGRVFVERADATVRGYAPAELAPEGGEPMSADEYAALSKRQTP